MKSPMHIGVTERSKHSAKRGGGENLILNLSPLATSSFAYLQEGRLWVR